VTTLRRVLVVILLVLIILVFWAWVAKTPWGHTVNPFTAGRRYLDPVGPIAHVVVVIGIVTPSVILLRAGWSWYSRVILGREVRRRIPARVSNGGDPRTSRSRP
jgi:hypothetical protein